MDRIAIFHQGHALVQVMFLEFFNLSSQGFPLRFTEGGGDDAGCKSTNECYISECIKYIEEPYVVFEPSRN